MPKFNYSKLTQGFTLIELLVVIAIIGTLSLAVFPMISSFQSDQDLSNAAQEMKTAFSLAQTNAINGVKCGATDLTGPSSARASSWILIPTGPIGYDVRPSCSNGNNIPLKSYNLPDNVFIIQMTLTAPSATYVCSTNFQDIETDFANITGQVNFVETPPGGSSCIGGDITQVSKLQIVLHSDKNAHAITLTVDSSGSVSVSPITY